MNYPMAPNANTIANANRNAINPLLLLLCTSLNA